METAVLRSELKSYIDTLPDNRLQAAQSVLSTLAAPDYDLDNEVSPELRSEMLERLDEYRRDPSCGVPLRARK